MIKVTDGMKIVFIGDSITDVKFNKREKKAIKGANSYPLQVTKKIKDKGIKVKAFFEGIASNRSWHVYDRLSADCISKNPDIVVLFIGVNDAWEEFCPQGFPPMTRPFEPHFREIMRRLKAELIMAQVIVMTPFVTSTISEKQGLRSVLNKYIDLEKSIASEFGFNEIIDLQTVFDEAEKTTNPNLLSLDSIHPTDAGHSVIAKEILKRLKI